MNTFLKNNLLENEIYKRILKLKFSMEKNGIDACLITQKANLFYFSASLQKSYLYVSVNNEPILLVFKNIKRALKESPIRFVYKIEHYSQIKEIIFNHGCRVVKKIGLEFDVLPYNMFFLFKKKFVLSSFVDISNIAKIIRAKKSEYEISIIKQTAKKSDKLMDYSVNLVKLGRKEIAISGLIEAEAKKLGHNGLLRMRSWGNEVLFGSLMSGICASIPSCFESPNGGVGIDVCVSHGSGVSDIKLKEPIILDFVFLFKGYVSDQTRILSCKKLPSYLLDGHKFIIELISMLVEMSYLGMTSGELYDICIKFVKNSKFEKNFMGFKENKVKFIGHGVGIELDEYPIIAKKQKLRLKTGMVLALEPKLVFPGRGILGIENTYLVTKYGLKNLHKFPMSVQSIH